MVTYDEFNAFKSENTAQHAETRERLERLTTQVAVLDARMTAFQRTQNLTNRLFVALIGTTGATAMAMMYAALTR